jgi:magnesium transporter
LEQVHTALEQESAEALSAATDKIHPADLAEIFQLLDGDQQSQLVYLLPSRTVAEMLAELGEAARGEVVEDLSEAALTEIVSELSPDDAADVLGELPEVQREEVLEQMPDAQSDQIEQLLVHDEESAGGIMTPELISLPETATVGQAVEEVRRASEDEEIHYVYVVDGAGRLKGLVPLRRLVTNPPETALINIAEVDPVTVHVNDDQELVAHKISKYDVSAVPVLDNAGRLLGRVTHDDVFDVAEEEADEDMYYMAGTQPSELEDQSVFRAAFIRFRWLMACMIGTTCTAMILAFFEGPFPSEVYLALVLFVPMMGAMGGNSGIQISTIIVRALATGEIAATRIVRSFLREGRIALVMAPLCGIVACLICLLGLPLWQRLTSSSSHVSPYRLSLSVGIGMTVAILVAAALGMTLPHLFRRIGVDPAIASGPIVTTANDVVSISLYFAVALIIMT